MMSDEYLDPVNTQAIDIDPRALEGVSASKSDRTLEKNERLYSHFVWYSQVYHNDYKTWVLHFRFM